MKILLICFLLSLSATLLAQQEVHLQTPKDSVSIPKVEPVKRLSFNLEWGLANMPGFKSNSFLSRRLHLGNKPFDILGDNSPQNFLRPLRMQYEEQQRLAPYYYILGTLEAGATGYLLYQHLKKHSDLY